MNIEQHCKGKHDKCVSYGQADYKHFMTFLDLFSTILEQFFLFLRTKNHETLVLNPYGHWSAWQQDIHFVHAFPVIIWIKKT